MNWTTALAGLKTRKPQYGIVVHGVPTLELDSLKITDKEIQDIMQQNESKNIKIESMVPLRRKLLEQGAGPPPKHASIVIFTYDAEAADKCIRLGLNIHYRNYPVEKYAPQLRVTQCYNCHKYGHHAQHCRSKAKCRKCRSEEHTTSDCVSPDSIFLVVGQTLSSEYAIFHQVNDSDLCEISVKANVAIPAVMESHLLLGYEYQTVKASIGFQQMAKQQGSLLHMLFLKVHESGPLKMFQLSAFAVLSKSYSCGIGCSVSLSEC